MSKILTNLINKLDALERDNALLKSQVRTLSAKIDNKEKALAPVVVRQPEKITDNNIVKLVKSTVTLTFVNKLYGKNNG